MGLVGRSLHVAARPTQGDLAMRTVMWLVAVIEAVLAAFHGVAAVVVMDLVDERKPRQ